MVARWKHFEVVDDDGHSLGWLVTPEFATKEEARLAAKLLDYEIVEEDG